jgi:hypothetical protein
VSGGLGERAYGPRVEGEWERDAVFLSNVADARENGFEFVCSECGSGIYDENDMHDSWCSRGQA